MHKFMRDGKLPDGRDCFGVHVVGDDVWVVTDPSVLQRTHDRLEVPEPGEVARDGYVTPWEKYPA